MSNFCLVRNRFLLLVVATAVVVAVVLVLRIVFAAGPSGTADTPSSHEDLHVALGSSPATAVSPSAAGIPDRGTAVPLPPAPVASGSASTPAVWVLPVTANPRAFAIAYAAALFSYDTRTQSEAQWIGVLAAGLDPAADVHPENLEDVAGRTPPDTVWATMTDSSQRASFTLTNAAIPALWTQNATQYPAGAAAITVTGTQQVLWAEGSSEVPVSVTLLLVCPPLHEACVVNRIATQVLP
jgi:hypothetical protein